jgi:hypothetical protein
VYYLLGYLAFQEGIKIQRTGATMLQTVQETRSIQLDLGGSYDIVLSTKLNGGRSGPEAGRSTPVGRTVRACVEQIRVPSFVLRLLARFAELAREISL